MLKRFMIEHKQLRLYGAAKILSKFKYIDFWLFYEFSASKSGLILEIGKSGFLLFKILSWKV